MTANTTPGAVLGTVGYMAPEQVRGQPVDHRADVFALGAVLYEMLSGRRAFRGETSADTLGAILTIEPPDPDPTGQQIPRTLQRIMARCLDKRPEARFQSTRDLVFGLEALGSPAAEPSGVAAGVATRGRRVPLIGLALLAALGAAVFVYATRPAPDDSVLRLSVLPPPGLTIADRSGVPARRLAISPDGQRMAFTAAGADGKVWLWVRRLDSLSAERLEGSEGAVYPFWSPDGRFLAFFSEDGRRRSKLMRTDAAGATPTTLCELPAPNSTGGTWGLDGTILFGTFGSPSAREIQRVPAAGGTPSPVTRLDTSAGETRHYTPYFLPGGRRFLYLAVQETSGGGARPTGLFVGSLDSSERTLLQPVGSVAKYAAGHLLFLRDTTLMAQALDPTTLELGGEAVPIAEQILVGGPTGASGAFSVSENGRLIYQAGSLLPSQLTWFDRDGRPVGVLGEPAFYGDLALSPDGTQVAVTVSGGGADDADIWVYDVARRFGTRMTSHTAMDRGAVWSKADGRLAFVSNRAGPSIDVFVKPGDRADGEAPLVGTPDEDEVAESWSPDGRFLIYGASPAAGAPGGGLFVWSFADRRATPLVQTRFAETQARFSPDGRWVAYISNDSGPFQVYVTPFPGPGPRSQISVAGGSRPQWRGDGKEIIYLAPGGMLTAVAVQEHQSGKLEVGRAHQLFPIRPRPFFFGNPYEVSADGERFLVNVPVEDNAPTSITVVFNWPALIKR
jgi:Tol biopolymer transport system component